MHGSNNTIWDVIPKSVMDTIAHASNPLKIQHYEYPAVDLSFKNNMIASVHGV